jgi:putative protease
MNHAFNLRKPELLAPAGNPDAFRAAVNNGADAVYLGVKALNARRQAENFSLAELEEAVRYAHLRNVRVYLTTNILVKERELREAFALVESAVALGVDGFIVQDLGLARLLARSFSGIRLHASTQVNCHNVPSARLLAERGFTRVVLARETSLAEAERIKRESPVEVEIFAHGALCFSYSGQCLFSSLVGGRSGNRGLCAQPCRLAYTLIESGPSRTRALDLPYNYLLSTRDLMTLPLLPAFMRAGIDSLKIEGRLKSPEYVATVTGVYRREIDRAFENPDAYEPLEESIALLEEAFSRGFTHAYLAGTAGNELMSYRRPNNRGAFLGRVTFTDPYRGVVGFTTKRPLETGDVIEIWVSKGGRVVQRIEHLAVDGTTVETADAGARVEVGIDKGLHLVSPGDRIHRVYSRALDAHATVSFLSESAPVALDIEAVFAPNAPVRLRARAGGATVAIEPPIVPEPATHAPLTVERVVQQLSKLGGTAYHIANCKVDIEGSLFLPVKKINELRRLVVSELDRLRLEAARPRVARVKTFEEVYHPAERPQQRLTPVLTVKVADVEAAHAALAGGADIVYVASHFWRKPWEDVRAEIERLERACAAREAAFGLAIPNVVKDSELDRYHELASALSPDSFILCDTLGIAAELAREGRAVVADYHLNLFNSETARALKELGLRRAAASVELSRDELVELARSTGFPLEVLVHGDLEAMAAEHCVLLAAQPGAQSAPCGQRLCERASYALKDARGYEFPVRLDRFCRSHIFNSRTLCAPEFIGELHAAGISYFRLELVLERPRDEVRALVRAYRELLDDLVEGAPRRVERTQLCPQASTRGHLARGVA